MKAWATIVGLAIAALSVASEPRLGDDPRERQKQSRASDAKPAQWSAPEIARDTLSAVRLIGAPVRGANGRNIGEVHDIIVSRHGNIIYVVAEVGGIFGVAEQRIGVPWPDVSIDREMRWVQTPLVENDDGKVSAFGFVSRDENIPIPGLTWYAGDLIGDYVRLDEPVRYALVADVLFSRDGTMQSVVVRRVGSPVGPGWDYAYPYAGYKPARYADPLRFATENVPLFDHVKLDELSRVSNDREKLAATRPRK